MTWVPMLRVAAVTLFVASLVLAMATFRTVSESRRWMGTANGALMGYALSARTLELDLLNARAGILRNYDAVNDDLASGRRHLGVLRQLELPASAEARLRDLSNRDRRQEELVERFKSDNALLQNSLARFRADGEVESRARDALAAPVLALTLDTSPQTVRGAVRAIERVPPVKPGSIDAQFLAHGRLLVELLPEVDRLLRSIRSLDVGACTSDLQSAIRAESARRAAEARYFEVAIALTLLLFVAAVASLVLLQRWMTRELEEQAANARLSAAIAVPLIDSGKGDFVERVQDAVQRLGLHLGARNVQISIPDIAGLRLFSWPDRNLDRAWLSGLVDAADEDGSWKDCKVIVSKRGDGRSSRLARAMDVLGLDQVLLLRTVEPSRVLIGFELPDEATAERRDHVAGVGSALVAIAHGVRRELLQVERERLDRRLARTRRMEMVGAMASGVAHNFNNIIGAIAGFAELGQEQTRRGSKARNSFEEISAAAHRGRDLVDDILDFGRQGRSIKRPLNLADVLARAVRLLRASVRNDDAFLLAADNRYAVVGSATDLEQVLLNIGTNAAHASAGKSVDITARRIALEEEEHFSHGRLETGRYVVVTIADRGPGVRPQALPQLFEPFFTTKAGGTGLGLSTAWEIVQDHGGTIDVRERPGGGACFSLWLPELAVVEQHRSVQTGAQILILADGDVLATGEDVLADLGYEPVGLVLSADEARLAETVPACDAVLVATTQPALAEAAVGWILPLLADRPLLVATRGDVVRSTDARVFMLDYPLQAAEIAGVLSGSFQDDRLIPTR